MAGRLAASLLERVRLGRYRTAGAAAAVVFLALFPLGTLLPEQAEALSHAYHAHTPEPLRRLKAAGVGPSALVLVAGNTVEWTYGSFLLENGTDPRRATFRKNVPSFSPPTREKRSGAWTSRCDRYRTRISGSTTPGTSKGSCGAGSAETLPLKDCRGTRRSADSVSYTHLTLPTKRIV